MSYRDYTPNQPSQPISLLRVAGWAALVIGIITLAIVLIVLLIAGLNAFGRAQARADANNQVAITKIHIRRELAQVKVVTADNGVVNAQAQQRYLAAIGIKRAQDEIAKTLTPLYNQFEEIQAQKAIATSGQNNTVVYVPAGQSGVPVITANAATGK